MNIHGNLTPSTHKISDLVVFVSYQTIDFEFAGKVRKGLEGVGLIVELYEPRSEDDDREPEDAIRLRLRRSLVDADFICLINGEKVSTSDWVAYEFAHASLILGRVILVNTGFTVVPGQGTADKLLERGAELIDQKGLHVNHSTLNFHNFGSVELYELVVQLLNPPSIKDPEHEISRSGLKGALSDLKHARLGVCEDARFGGLQVEDVIPVKLPMDGEDRPSSGDLGLTLRSRGRADITDRVRREELDIVYATYANVGAYVAILPGFVRTKQHIKTGNYEDPRDGNEYKTVTINNRTWFAENLRYEHKHSALYENDLGNLKEGRLYDWDAAIASCPPGWHLPSRREFGELFFTFSHPIEVELSWDTEARERAYEALRTGGISKFQASLSGFQYYSGEFMYIGLDGYYWSSTQTFNGDAHVLQLRSGDEEVDFCYAMTSAKHSVRCVKGESLDFLPHH